MNHREYTSCTTHTSIANLLKESHLEKTIIINQVGKALPSGPVGQCASMHSPEHTPLPHQSGGRYWHLLIHIEKIHKRKDTIVAYTQELGLFQGIDFHREHEVN